MWQASLTKTNTTGVLSYAAAGDLEESEHKCGTTGDVEEDSGLDT